MNKHIFGFILFSLIVGTSAVIYGFLASPAVVEPVFVFENQPQKRKSCRKQMYSRVESKEVSAKVVQAVLNSNTNQLEMDLFLERENNSIENAAVRLHFFSKEGARTRYLATEKVVLTPEFNFDNKATQSITSSYEWLDNLRSRSNLYVVPQTIADGENYRSVTPRFDEEKAMPITLMGEE